MRTLNKKALYALALVLFAASAAARWSVISSLNVDMTVFYVKFYEYLAEKGFAAMGENFSLGTPLYLYFVWLATFTQGLFEPHVGLKLMSMSFDLLSAAAVAAMVRLKYEEPAWALVAAAGFLCLPTVIANSAMWGQIDALYASFLLWCVYYLMKDRPLPALIAFGLAASMKLQVVFLLPFLFVMFLKGRIKFWHFFAVPAVYILTIIPAVLAGRPFMEALTIYLAWPDIFPYLSVNAPNLYSLIGKHSDRVLQMLYYAGLAATCISLAAWSVFYALRRFTLTPKTILLTAFMSVALVPFVMPKMHDRYFYPADVLSFPLAFFWTGSWYIALGYQLISGLVYYTFLFSVTDAQNHNMLVTAVVINTVMVGHLLIRQWMATKTSADPN